MAPATATGSPVKAWYACRNSAVTGAPSSTHSIGRILRRKDNMADQREPPQSTTAADHGRRADRLLPARLCRGEHSCGLSRGGHQLRSVLPLLSDEGVLAHRDTRAILTRDSRVLRRA